MTKFEKQITRHHKVARSMGGSNHFNNIEEIERNKHRAHHLLFDNDLPHEQIKTIVDRTGKVFTNSFKDDVLSVINDYDIQRIYSSKCGDIKRMVQFILDND